MLPIGALLMLASAAYAFSDWGGSGNASGEEDDNVFSPFTPQDISDDLLNRPEDPPEDPPVDPVDPPQGDPADPPADPVDPPQDDPVDPPADPVDPIPPNLVVTTDPETGDVHVEVDEDEDGTLAFILNKESTVSSSYYDDHFDAMLIWLPDGINIEDFDNSEFVNANDHLSNAGRVAAMGGTVLEEWDLGANGSSESETSGQFLSAYDTRVQLPEVTSNTEISYYSNQHDPNNAFPENFVEVDGPEAFEFDFETLIYTSTLDEETLDYVPNEEGAVVQGTEESNLIIAPRNDDTAVTIFGGDGEDTIHAGLNDTIITNDDSDADEIRVFAPFGHGETFGDVPTIEAGPEDTVVALGDNNSVIFYEVETAPGVTEHYFHIVSSEPPGPVPQPGDLLDENGDPITIEEYYALAGLELLAIGTLGVVDISDPNAPQNTRSDAPAFSGIEGQFLEVTLQGDAMSANTDILPLATSATPV